MTPIPVGVGLGISTPQQAAWIVEFVDAVVIGSALVQTIERASGRLAKAHAAGDFVSKIRRAMKRSRSNGRKR